MDEAIRAVLESDPRVAYALVFGSHASGRATSRSDLDVAVGAKRGAALDHRAIGDLTVRLEHATGLTVDLVLLDHAPARVVMEKDRRARVTRQAQVVLEYLDFAPVERRCARAVLDAAARG